MVSAHQALRCDKSMGYISMVVPARSKPTLVDITVVDVERVVHSLARSDCHVQRCGNKKCHYSCDFLCLPVNSTTEKKIHGSERFANSLEIACQGRVLMPFFHRADFPPRHAPDKSAKVVKSMSMPRFQRGSCPSFPHSCTVTRRSRLVYSDSEAQIDSHASNKFTGRTCPCRAPR